MARYPIVHIEWPVEACEPAAAFCRQMFGWTVTHYVGAQYAAADTGGITVGFNAAYDVLVEPGRPVIYVVSRNVDGDLSRAYDLGADVLLPPTPLPESGFMGMIEDPAGNTLVLLNIRRRRLIMQTERRIVRVDIPAHDREITGMFYQKLFGWRYEHAPGRLKYTAFSGYGLTGGFPQIDGKVFERGDVTAFVGSEDLDADLERAEQLGAEILVGKTNLKGYGRLAIFYDPSGNRMALWQALETD
jgi:predicted enzyme related to lactoylglutathione lyase